MSQPDSNYVTPCCGVDVTQPGVPTIKFRPNSGRVVCGNCGRDYLPDPDREPLPITTVRLKKRADGALLLLVQYLGSFRCIMTMADPATFTGRVDYSPSDIKAAPEDNT